MIITISVKATSQHLQSGELSFQAEELSDQKLIFEAIPSYQVSLSNIKKQGLNQKLCNIFG